MQQPVHVEETIPHDIGLGRGTARILVSVGVVGFICIVMGFVLYRYADFVESENQARREDFRAIIAEMKAARETDRDQRERSLTVMLQAITAFEKNQLAIDQAVIVLQRIARELADMKTKGG